jgi:hypothetical protein
MMTPDTKTFNASANSRDAIGILLATHGVNLDATQPTGDVQANGWDIAWSTPAPGKIAITVNKHPFLEESLFWSKLTEILGEPE